MSFLDRLFPDDHKTAEKYAGRESATSRAQRRETAKSAKRRASHRNSGALRAARAGQAWEDNDRHRERYGRKPR